MSNSAATLSLRGMDITSSMRRKSTWSYLNHDLLLLVMMQLGVIDFLAFSGVCKSWRSVALGNWKRFMASQPPMLMYISLHRDKDRKCCLEDYEGRDFKTTLTHSAGMRYVGLSCGYLIFFRYKTKDFCLVNLITRHELTFPSGPRVSDDVIKVTSILVFSPSNISKFVFFVLEEKQIWFSIAGDESWNHVSSTFDFDFDDLHAFEGKIYIVSSRGHLCEFTLKPEPRLTLLKDNNLLVEKLFFPELVSWGKNLYVMEGLSDLFKVYKLDFCEMEWVLFQDTGNEHAFTFFLGASSHGATAEPKSWADHLPQNPPPEKKRI